MSEKAGDFMLIAWVSHFDGRASDYIHDFIEQRVRGQSRYGAVAQVDQRESVQETVS